jgi:hypothetical protein
MDIFKLDDVPAFTQMDNKYKPHVSCFPTSLAMGMSYCLKLRGLDKTAVGCGRDEQLEDFINFLLEDSQTIKWIEDTNVKYGGWFLPFLKKKMQRRILIVEAYLFNRLMSKFGYRARVNTFMTYDRYCVMIEEGYPVILVGDFSSVSRIGGHVVCGIGYDNTLGVREVIVNDPYGNALLGYPKEGEMLGSNVSYPLKLFFKSKNYMWGVILETIG